MTDSNQKVQSTQDLQAQNEHPGGAKVQLLKWHKHLLIPGFLATLGMAVFFWALFAYETMPVMNRMLGQSPRNIMMFAAPGFSLLMISIWFYLFSTFKVKTRVCVFLLSLIPIGGLFAAIRKIDVSGDMAMIPRWRWEESAEQRLEDFHAKKNIDSTKQEIPAIVIDVRPEDMVQFRGRDFSGIVTGPAVDISISSDRLPPKLWQFPIGSGYSQFSITGDFMVTMEQRKNEELVTCYHKKTGMQLWKYSNNELFFEAMGGTGPRSTPTIHKGRVYSLGALGHAACLDLATGKKIWSKDLLVLDGKKLGNISWGLSSSPLVLDDRVIFNPGAPDGFGLVACKLDSGDFLWQGEGYKNYPQNPSSQNFAGYSTPFVVELAGVKQILHYHGKGLSGVNPDNGNILWTYKYENGPGVNVCQPIVLPENQIVVSASYGKGTSLLKINFANNTWTVDEVWHNEDLLRAKFSNSVLHEGFVYGINEGTISCIDPLKGIDQWKKKSRDKICGHGQLLLTGNHLLILWENGDLSLVEANPNEFKQVWKFPALKEYPPKRVWNPPALVDGIIYLRDHTEMAAYDIREDKSESQPAVNQAQK